MVDSARSLVLLAALATWASGCGCGKTFSIAEVCGDGGVAEWSGPRLVQVLNGDGSPYQGDVQEPEVRDFGGARWLFFNDDPKDGNKNLEYARWEDGLKAFVVLGPLPGSELVTPAVDGNPSLDQDGGFFFVSTRTFPNPNETVYSGALSVSGSPPVATVSGVKRLDGLTRPGPSVLSMGVQVSWDGAWLFFDEATFEGPLPVRSEVVAARRSAAGYARLPDAEQAALLGKVNTPEFLEYAETLSLDGKELYFTRTWVTLARADAAVMCVMRSTRADATGAFGAPVSVAATAPAPGVVMEAPSLSPDQKTLYYHRRNPGERFSRLYAVDRP